METTRAKTRTKNKTRKSFLLGLLFFFGFVLIIEPGFSAPIPPVNSYCNVLLGNITFKIQSASGQRILLLDEKGNMVIYGNVYLYQQNFPSSISNALIIKGLNNFFVFNSSASYIKGNIYQRSSVPYNDGNDFIIRDVYGNRMINFNSNGNIYLNGYAIYDGSQANCPSGESCKYSFDPFQGGMIFRCTTSPY